MLRVVTLLLERAVRSASPSSGSYGGLHGHRYIKKVVADRGFGFIAAEDGKEYFFHRGGLDASLDFDRLQGGERVEFEVAQSPKGPRANHVHAAAGRLGRTNGPPTGRPVFFALRRSAAENDRPGDP